MWVTRRSADSLLAADMQVLLSSGITQAAAQKLNYCSHADADLAAEPMQCSTAAHTWVDAALHAYLAGAPVPGLCHPAAPRDHVE